MSKKVFYEKKGRRYVPVAEYDSDFMDSFPSGNHLVMCYPGGSSRRFNIDPTYAPLIAASRVAEDAISRKIMEHSAMRVPEKERPLTDKQLKAWRAFNKAMGDDRFALEYCSYREAAEEGVKAMIAEADKLMENPIVRKAYERFLLIAELAKDHNAKSNT